MDFCQDLDRLDYQLEDEPVFLVALVPSRYKAQGNESVVVALLIC